MHAHLGEEEGMAKHIAIMAFCEALMMKPGYPTRKARKLQLQIKEEVFRVLDKTENNCNC